MHSARWYQAEAEEALFEFYSTPRKMGADGKPERKNALVCIPGGGGKSHVIANFFRRAFQMHPSTRAIMSTHVKTLIEQNLRKLQETWPLAPVGIYSAGLKSADTVQPIVFGGVQSMAGKFPKFGHRDFLVIDEAHLVGDDGSYLKFIQELMQSNPYLKIIGLSATPYRLGMGCLTNGNIFTDIVYDICNIDGFARLIAEGHLVPLIPPRNMPDGTQLVQIDTSGVGMSKGEFNQGELSAAMKSQKISFPMMQQFVQLGADRHSWMFFANGVEEAEEAAFTLNTHFGIPTVCMHSKQTAKANDDALIAWKTGAARCAVNMGMLTTGVDHPALDYIGIGRATMSTGLWVQILSRGTRPYSYLTERNPIVAAAFPYVKKNCLVADFAGNTRRLGPINDPLIPKQKGSGPPGDAPVRVCPSCSCYNNASARNCLFCDAEFTFTSKLNDEASTAELLRSDLPEVETIKVDHVHYASHIGKQSKKSSIKVAYYCGLRTYYEWVTVEGIGGRVNGRDWFRQRHPSEPPATNAEVLAVMSELRAPRAIRVWINANPHPRVMSAEF